MSVINDAGEPGLDDVAPPSARGPRRALVSDAMIDGALVAAGDWGVPLTAQGGLLPELVKAVLERGWSGTGRWSAPR